MDQIMAFHDAHPWVSRVLAGGAAVVLVNLVIGFIEGFRETRK